MVPTAILVIDDSEDDREVCVRTLRRQPEIGEIHPASSGRQGLEVYRNTAVDCILLDYNLPGENGLAVLSEIRELDPYCPVIMLTGQGSEEIAVNCLKHGASDYIVKDAISTTVLRRAILNAVDKRDLQRKLDDQRQEQEAFLRTLVHDIRAPLRHVVIMAEFVTTDLGTGVPNDLDRSLNTIVSAVGRLGDLVDTLTAYASLGGDIVFEQVALDRVAEAAIENLSQLIRDRNGEVTRGALPVVHGHAPQLTQLFQNLIGNGLKYNESPRPHVSIDCVERADGSCTIGVSDNGIGIPESRTVAIFEPFKRLWSRDRYEGSGLGLAICKKVVHRHDGEIWCESEKGRGSQFRFTLNPTDVSADPSPFASE